MGVYRRSKIVLSEKEQEYKADVIKYFFKKLFTLGLYSGKKPYIGDYV
jgi:hypothetical protein